MTKTITRSVLFAVLILFAANQTRETTLDLDNVIKPFSLEEAKPFLQTISKLHDVVVVNPSPYLKIGWPRICWLTDANFGVINTVSWKFRGQARWYLLSDMPRTCLVAEALQTGLPEDAADPSSWRRAADRIRQIASGDLPRFASFLEDQLDLKDKPSLGYRALEHELELPLMEDRAGSGRPVALVSDPKKYAAKEGLPTSLLDRTIHYWITEKEYDLLYDILNEEQGRGSKPKSLEYPLLWRIASGSFENVVLYPSEVRSLAGECQRLSSATHNSQVTAALLKMQSVSQSAENYQLGICVPGG